MDCLKSLKELVSELEKFKFETEEDGWELFIKLVSERLACGASSFFTIDENKKIISFARATGPHSGEITGVSFGYTGVVGWCASNRKDLFVKNTKGHPLFSGKVDHITKFETKSIMCFCCYYGETLMGAVEFINPKNKPEFEDADFDTVKILLSLMSRIAYANKLEVTVKHLNDKAQSTINNLSGGFIGVDLEGRIIFFNPKAVEILEIKEDYMGKSYSELEKLAPDMKEAIKDVLVDNKIAKRMEFFYSLGGGRHKKIGYSTMNIKAVDGSVTGAGLIFQDITNL